MRLTAVRVRIKTRQNRLIRAPVTALAERGNLIGVLEQAIFEKTYAHGVGATKI